MQLLLCIWGLAACTLSKIVTHLHGCCHSFRLMSAWTLKFKNLCTWMLPHAHAICNILLLIPPNLSVSVNELWILQAHGGEVVVHKRVYSVIVRWTGIDRAFNEMVCGRDGQSTFNWDPWGTEWYCFGCVLAYPCQSTAWDRWHHLPHRYDQIGVVGYIGCHLILNFVQGATLTALSSEPQLPLGHIQAVCMAWIPSPSHVNLPGLSRTN